MFGLGDLDGGAFYSQAYGASGDGSIIVGQGTSALGSEAFIWDATNGMRNLKELLVGDYGLDLTGWTLTEARSISIDGNYIVGFGTNPSGNLEAWRADLRASQNPAVPEPSAILLALSAGLPALALRRHSKSRKDVA